ncbi:MAG: iron-sulfur cluster assembly protein [Actinobacteria bacterium]|nr:iron-sulfur cluster assembly protein [Actinomycetota bacterium]MCL5446993.1 iron-sulfur cluster assembly protein [Actinomycetota bacterium]
MSSFHEAAGSGAVSGGSVLDGVWEALKDVYDPELCLDIVSLGLVYGVYVDDGKVVVEMTLTTPGCPASESFPEIAASSIKDATGVPDAEIRLVWDPPWNPGMMDEESARLLGFGLR